MLFSSMSFIFVFLPLVLGAYFLVRRSLRNYVLLASSIIFYAWGEPEYFTVMIAVAAVNYLAALLMERFARWRKVLLTGALGVDLGILIYFKYTGFILENINALCRSDIDILQVAMPIGISFYIFQAISYLIDVYRKETAAQRDFFKLLLYVAFFPQMIAGPILKYHDVAEYLECRQESLEKFAYGLKRFICGLGKKMLIANVLGEVADRVFEGNGIYYPAWMSWVGVLAYSFQIYYDFSGYSDMAIGLGSLFGFKFMENFNYPYISGSVTEFWRRWHISLSTWFREYLYIPLGGNKVAKWRHILNLFIVFLATGIWHGASWNFVLWGVWHGTFLTVEKFFGAGKKELKRWRKISRYIWCMTVVFFGWIFFRAESIADAGVMVLRMFGLAGKSKILLPWQMFLSNEELIAFLAAVLCIFPVWGKWMGLSAEEREVPLRRRVMVNAGLLMIFLLSVVKLSSATSNPFIYFRF